MRILVICSHFPPQHSPEGQHAFLLCGNLGRSGAEVHLLTSPLLAGAPEPVGFTVHPEVTAWNWSGAWQLIRASRRIRPDVILLLYVSWIYSHHPMITFAPFFLRAANRNIRMVTQFESTEGGPRLESFRQRSRWRLAAVLAGQHRVTPKFGTLLTHSDGIIALSQGHADELRRACPAAAKRITLIPAPPLLTVSPEENGRARIAGRRMLDLDDNREAVVVVYFGYVYPGKGVETLLAAIALLRDRQPIPTPPCRFVVIGMVAPAFEAHLKLLEDRLQLGDRVSWLGYRADEACSDLLWASDIAVLPFDAGAQLNNSSLAVCAVHGLPIVTTEGATPEPAFRNRENVMLCPPRDPGALASAIEALMQSAGLRRQLGQGARAMARTFFSWDVTLPATLTALESVLKRPRSENPAASSPAMTHDSARAVKFNDTRG